MRKGRRAWAMALALGSASALAQEDAVVVTATRVPQPSLEVPASVDRIYADEIRQGKPQVNLSESLGRVPGIVVQNRQNYAQDLQISSRGFGARATFGVRGIRLIADGIPATMPDGQGQASTFALGSAERIEVLRGPFSALYGNAAGGVIVVDTEDPPGSPTVEPSFYAGSYDTWKAAVRFGGANALGDLSRFETDGYREHSAARRDQLNAKLKLGGWTVVANSLRQPESQDPGGLDRAAFEEDPRQASPNAEPFDTRKTVNQDQAGLRFQHRLGGSGSMEASLYAGQREVLQFLGFAGDFGLSSGGVVDLDRTYGGGALRFFIESSPSLKFSLGAEYDRMDEHRRGYVNDFGEPGELRRDEDDVVDSTDFYAQAEWRFAERWTAHGGLRTSRVEFRSTDHFVTATNPDDSGSRSYSETTPVAGLVFRATKFFSLYGNLGRGFETPTFAELAYRNTGTGLNFDLEPSRSKHAELGAKAILPGLARVNAAVFDIDVSDEIVVDVAANGRTTFRNAGHTARRGLELFAETLLPGPWSAQAAYTRLDATFEDGMNAGNLLPGVPRTQAYAALAYRRDAGYAQLEVMHRSRVAVNDANDEFAESYTVASVVAGLVQRGRSWRITEFVRIDNLTDETYAGSVIVNESNGRFYEPAPQRNTTIGVQASLQF
ncbi:MAG TPA: TonB-dependent receptor [Burkholderiales bacterium]|nr:TonB-dependent receptor [Burkholderiales bacterium]